MEVIVVEEASAPTGEPGTTQLDEEQLGRDHPQSTGEVLATVPGLHVLEEDGAGMRLNLSVRGLPAARSAKVLVLEDGVPIAPGPYGHPELYYVPAVERLGGVDVVRGSGTIRFGPQTLGGIVNLRTAPLPEGPLVALAAEGGSDTWRRAHGAVGGGDGRHGFRLDGVHRHFEGPRQIDLSAQELAAKVGTRVGATSLGAKLVVNRERSSPSYLGLTEAQFAEDPRQSHAVHDAFSLDRAAGLLSWSADLAPGVVASGAAYGHGITRAWTRQSYDRADAGADYERIVDGELYFLDEATTRDRLYTAGGVHQELIVSTTVRGTAVRLDVGARAHHEREHQQQYRGPLGGVGELVADEVWSGIGLSTWAYGRVVAGPWSVDGGARMESWEGTRTFRADGSAATTREGAVLPGLGVGVRADPSTLLYASLHRGWSPPQTGDAVTDQGTVLVLEAERSWNQEVGVRWAPGDHARLDLTAFWLAFENQVVPPTEAGAAAFVNGDPTRHLGVEASAAYVDPSPWRPSVELGYTFLDARYVDGALAGNALPYAAPHHATVRLAVTRGPVSAGLNVAYVAAQYSDAENTVAATPDGLVGRLPAYATIGARLGWTPGGLARGWSAWIVGKNLADDVYIASRAPAGIQPGGFRTVQVGLSWRPMER